MAIEFKKKASDRRLTYPLIARTDPTPATLREKTLENMIRRRQERERQKKRRRKTAMRVTAAAAFIAAIIVATPLRNYAVSAAQYAYNTIVGSWKENVFPVALKKSDKGCTVEIIESRTSNEFLYFTVRESFPVGMVSRDEETKMYVMPDITYSGKVSDGKGNMIAFDSESILCLWAVSSDHRNYSADYAKRVVTQEKDADSGKGVFSVNTQYKVYLPRLENLITSADRKYFCSLQAESRQTGSKMTFEFPIDKVDDVLQSKIYPIDRQYSLNGASVTLEKMCFSPSGADLIIRIDPDEGLDAAVVEDLLDNLEVSVEATGAESGLLVFQTNGRWNGSFLDFDEDVNASAIMESKPLYVHRNGQYYFILSDGADVSYDSYHMDQMTKGKITVQVETLRWNSRIDGYGDQLGNNSGVIEDVAVRAVKKARANYRFDENHILLKSVWGNLDISLLEIKETDTIKLRNGKYRHILTPDAEMTVSNWDSMVKDGTWENISLVNQNGETVMVISLQIETLDSSSGTYAPANVKCEVVDDNQHFTLRESDLTLHVAEVKETQTYDANVWINPLYGGKDRTDSERETAFTLNPAK